MVVCGFGWPIDRFRERCPCEMDRRRRVFHIYNVEIPMNVFLYVLMCYKVCYVCVWFVSDLGVGGLVGGVRCMLAR